MSGSLVSRALEVVLLGPVRPARRHHARVPRSHGQCAGQSDTPDGNRALESLVRGSWRERNMSGVTCVIELFRGLDAGSPLWTEVVTTNSQSAACARKIITSPGLIENSFAIMLRVSRICMAPVLDQTCSWAVLHRSHSVSCVCGWLGRV